MYVIPKFLKNNSKITKIFRKISRYLNLCHFLSSYLPLGHISSYWLSRTVSIKIYFFINKIWFCYGEWEWNVKLKKNYAIRASAFMWIKLFYKQIYFIRCTRIKYKRVRVTFWQIFVKCFKNRGFILFEDVISNCGEILIEVITYLLLCHYLFLYSVSFVCLFNG